MNIEEYGLYTYEEFSEEIVALAVRYAEFF